MTTCERQFEPDVVDNLCLLLKLGVFTALMLYLQFENANVFEPVAVLMLGLVHRQLHYLYFLVEKRHFIVATYELGADQVSLLRNLRRQQNFRISFTNFVEMFVVPHPEDEGKLGDTLQ